MIDKAELDAKSKEFEIHPSNVQRDYVFGWMLYAIFTQSSLKDLLFLKGGNALRKGYFENTRFSKDLDFGIPNDIQQQSLLEEVNRLCGFIQGKAGITFVLEENHVKEKFAATQAAPTDLKVYEVRVYFQDFYGHADHIRLKIAMDLTRFDKVILPLQKVKLIHPYSDSAAVVCDIRCMKLEEIIATKLKCLLQREHPPDLFDYVYSVKQMGGSLDRSEVLGALMRKTIFSRDPFILKSILLTTAFDFFRETWAVAIICAKNILISAEEAIATLIADIEVVFAGYTQGHGVQFAYFPPELRNPIMRAGRNQTLLKIRYKGSDRVVEPYSLKYLQRKDGAEREYLYVYNRAGGEHEPGIRMFVHEGIESLENTDEKFVPRYMIELSKSGEVPKQRYLFDPNKPSPIPRVRRVRSRIRGGLRYIYACAYCGKRFARTSQDSNLRPHKDKRGYSCGGRSSYYVGTKYS